MLYNELMLNDSGALVPVIENLLKTAGWFCWLLAFIWAAAGITFFPKWGVRAGVCIAVVTLTTFLVAALSFENRHILINGVWGFDLIVMLAMLCLRPRSNRDWAEDMQYSVQVQTDKDVVVLDNVRDFSYRSEEEFTASWTCRRVPLNGLEKVWLGVEQISAWEGSLTSSLVLSMKMKVAVVMQSRSPRKFIDRRGSSSVCKKAYSVILN